MGEPSVIFVAESDGSAADDADGADDADDADAALTTRAEGSAAFAGGVRSTMRADEERCGVDGDLGAALDD